MLQILPCPFCGKQSLIPLQVSLEASIRCPHCQAELVVGEVLLSQFSSWEIVDDPAESFGQPPRKLDPGVVVPVPPEDAGEQLELAPFDADEGAGGQSSLKAIARSAGKSEYERRRRKQKSPIWSIIPVVLGGLAAFPIALLIIWHVLGRDLAGLGPKVAAYAPWIVPKRFHSFSDDDFSGLRSVGRGRIPERGQSGFRQFDDVMPQPQPKRAPDLDSTKDSDHDAKSMGSSKTSQDSALGSSGGDRPNESNIIDKSDTPPNPGASAVPRTSVANALQADQPEVSPTDADYFSQIRACKKSVDDLAKSIEAKAADSRDLAEVTFRQLSVLAQVMGAVDKQSPVWRTIKDQAQPLASQITQNPKIVNAMTNLSRQALKKQSETDSGNSSQSALWLPTVLEVTDAELVDSVWQVRGKHAFDEAILIEIPRALVNRVAEGQKLFVLGVFNAGNDQPTSTPTFQVSYLYSM